MRKRYTNQFKAQVVQELLKEEKTLNQLAAEHGVHPNQLQRWKTIVLEGLPSLFSKDDQAAQAAAAAHEQQITELYAEIGWLTTEVTWLKKNSRCIINIQAGQRPVFPSVPGGLEWAKDNRRPPGVLQLCRTLRNQRRSSRQLTGPSNVCVPSAAAC